MLLHLQCGFSRGSCTSLPLGVECAFPFGQGLDLGTRRRSGQALLEAVLVLRSLLELGHISSVETHGKHHVWLIAVLGVGSGKQRVHISPQSHSVELTCLLFQTVALLWSGRLEGTHDHQG